jgi:glutamine synthetase
LKNGKDLRPMASAGAAEPLPKSLQESLNSLKRDDVLLSVMGQELRIAYMAVREYEAQNGKSLDEEVAAALSKA